MEKTITSKEYQAIIKKIIQAREESGLRQIDVAKKFKRHQSYVSRLESGEYRVDVLELKKLAKLYKKEVQWFFC